MPTIYFDIPGDADTIIDDEGIELPNISMAPEMVLELLGQAMARRGTGGVTRWNCEIRMALFCVCQPLFSSRTCSASFDDHHLNGDMDQWAIFCVTLQQIFLCCFRDGTICLVRLS
ncbi:DUF6894 family protein [Bradyrhizobium sp. Arg816]|uniref:DUF6894 family protein n=1 Tax=Bradyrhizobium sp. Arg816 TaxID=2998491 RepID=UPI00249EC2BB|nr:hypothetical protein [Bradyrhizobium sp. Arg816]